MPEPKHQMGNVEPAETVASVPPVEAKPPPVNPLEGKVTGTGGPPPLGVLTPEPVKPVPVVKPEVKPEAPPKSYIQCCVDLTEDLGAAVSSRDPVKLEDCWERMDELTSKLGDNPSPGDRDHHAALAARFAALAPRKTAAIKAIAASLEADLAGKPKPVPVKIENPAVTKAKAALAALRASHAGDVELPSDKAAIEALEAKIAAIPLEDEK